MRAYGCNGSIRLEAVDSDYRPVRAPVAFVELGAAMEDAIPRSTETPAGFTDLFRGTIEGQTRAMEAMQSAQVEGERALAEKERALADAQVAMQRSHTELMLALLEHATGGKRQDPLTILKQGFAFQKTLQEGTGGVQRNAGPVEVVTASPAEESTAQTVAKWVGAVAPWLPHMGNAFANVVAGDNPAKAAEIRRNASVFGELLGGFASMAGGSATMQQQIPMFAVPAAPVIAQTHPRQIDLEREVQSSTPMPVHMSDDMEDEEEEEEERPTPCRALRQVLAEMEDPEAAALNGYLDSLDEDEFDQVGQAADQIPSLEARIAWARGLTYGAGVEGAATVDDSPARVTPSPTVKPDVGLPKLNALGVPPALLPVLAQLSPEEQMHGAQLLQTLDVATIERLTARLVAIAPAAALALMGRTIAHAQQRAPSAAHRAVMTALAEEGQASASNGGAA